MDLAKFVSMLQNGGLYFAVLAQLGDDMEAAPPRLPKGAGPLEEERVFGGWSLFRCISFANCWHRAEHESAAMWAIYAGRHQGVAIQSTLKALSKAFPTATEEHVNKMLKIGFVEYIDPDAEEPLPFLIDGYKAVLRKRLWYSYEQEVRLICNPPDNWVEPTSMGARGGFKRSGVWVRCDLKEAIQNVVVAPKSPPYLEAAVREVFGRFGFDPGRVKPSGLNQTVAAPNSDALRAALRAISQPSLG